MTSVRRDVISWAHPAGPSAPGPDSSQHQYASLPTKLHDAGGVDGFHGDRTCLPHFSHFHGRPGSWRRGEDALKLYTRW